MKVFQCVLSGTPKVGDVIHLHQIHGKGGRCTTGHTVKQVNTTVENPDGTTSTSGRVENLSDIAAWLVNNSNHPGSFHGPSLRAKENVLTIIDPSSEPHEFIFEALNSSVTGAISEIA